ncbi:HugZ family pyridoxamine 5'-phosphate oxidase [Rhizobium sp. C4]|uniref:HugZ family pyridoxamine 5'-phosphate oxidase n=1 Tax=Rhizobium sp. C4 TaxID=1349800 RepID=UPI001E440C32|nr:pyridoxamine 5'-phosphate oxidase family protein [Rhizobium sp. C4]MCD2173907.1 pyridoxamine 5'-phosphate oxidase family protein [Rhizobium sp. C4]
MSKDDKPKVLRDTDDEARSQARELIVTARFAAIAVIDPETGYPNSSRVLTATDGASQPVILASRLAAHTKALLALPRCSLLFGEPGKGDPLAWPRISLQCDALPVAADDPERPHLRARFLRRHPKAALYVDFPDFLFFRLRPVAASLNGGFGRAYALQREDFDLPEGLTALSWEAENQIVDSTESLAEMPAGFRIASFEPDCIVIVSKEQTRRINRPKHLT